MWVRPVFCKAGERKVGESDKMCSVWVLQRYSKGITITN